ncbi:unnamed protein product [Closterium sp. Yama58-4]|nr:unnamed protein product [Closterium sp. Yama58-4]
MLFEAVPYSRSQTGTTFAMRPNGIKALEGLKPGLGDAVVGCGSTITKTRFVNRYSELENSDGWVVKETAASVPMVGWARGQEVIASSLTRPEIIKHGHRVVAYYPVVAGKPVVNRGGELQRGGSNDGAGEGEVEAVDVVLEVVGSNPEIDSNDSTFAVSEGAGTAEEAGAVQQQLQLVVVRAKVLVAADGVRSAVRNQMIGDSPRYLEQFGWNALVPNPPSARVYPQEDHELLVLTDKVTGYQIFLFDAGHGKTFWQDFRFLAAMNDSFRFKVRTADPDGKLKAKLKKTPFGGFGKPGVMDRVMCHVSKNVADPTAHDTWHTVLQAVTITDPGNIYERWMMDRPPPKDSWSDSKCGNRVVLMGDAAHAMHTGPGQGAQTAFEDAHQLSLCLADVKDMLAEPVAVAAAVREYEARRIDRCVKIHAYATGMLEFGEEGKLVKALSPPERIQRLREFQNWVHAYPDKIKGDPESTYFK